jgi:hypothetical protein
MPKKSLKKQNISVHFVYNSLNALLRLVQKVNLKLDSSTVCGCTHHISVIKRDEYKGKEMKLHLQFQVTIYYSFDEFTF